MQYQLKTITFTEGGIKFTIPAYMKRNRKEIVDWTFKKLLEKLEKEYNDRSPKSA